MIQMPNIVCRPLIWMPAIISSAILGPVSSALLKMTCSPIGSGMGTSGLVGQIETYFTMVGGGTDPVVVVTEIIVMHIILPAVLALGISEVMRKIGWIKKGDMRLTV